MKRLLVMLLLIIFLVFPAMAYAKGTTIRYEVEGEQYEGYLIYSGKSAPFLLLLHDWDGLTDYEVQRSQALAELGYTVFAADLFGAGIRPVKVLDKRQHTGELYKNRKKMRTLIMGALDTAKANGANIQNGVVFGYCFGGAAVLELARSGVEMKGFVTFHGGLTTPEGQNYEDTDGKILVLHGGADSMISMGDFARLAEELEEEGVEYEMISYSGAPHAFTVFGSKGYTEDADKKSWRRFVDFLSETIR